MVFFSYVMSYFISGLVREFMFKGYDDDYFMVVCIYDFLYFLFFVLCFTLIMNISICIRIFIFYN